LNLNPLPQAISNILVNDIPTGKVIFTEDTWKDLVSEQFNIISAEVKEGILYSNQSKWLEIVAEK